MAELNIRPHPDHHSSPDALEKARRDTHSVFAFMRDQPPTSENLEKLRTMLADPTLSIDYRAICFDGERSNGCLLTMVSDNAYRRLLLEAGAPKYSAYENLIDPLCEALRKCDVEFVRLLLDHGADPSKPWKDQLPYQFIHTSATSQYVTELLQSLVQHGFDPNIMMSDENSSWRWGEPGEEKFRAMADLGANLIRRNPKGDLIETPITHGSPTISRALKERRGEALKFAAQFEIAIEPVRLGEQRPDQCHALVQLSTSQLMMLSNVGKLHLAFRPTLWRGHEQQALKLATHLYPYQQATLARELTSLHTLALASQPGWTDRLAQSERQAEHVR